MSKTTLNDTSTKTVNTSVNTERSEPSRARPTSDRGGAVHGKIKHLSQEADLFEDAGDLQLLYAEAKQNVREIPPEVVCKVETKSSLCAYHLTNAAISGSHPLNFIQLALDDRFSQVTGFSIKADNGREQISIINREFISGSRKTSLYTYQLSTFDVTCILTNESLMPLPLIYVRDALNSDLNESMIMRHESKVRHQCYSDLNALTS